MRVAAVVLCLALAGCGGDVTIIVGPADAGTDAGPPRVLSFDAGPGDAGPSDAALPDAGDAGDIDPCTRTLLWADTFEDGDLSIGDGGGFEVLNNAASSNGSVVERDGALRIVTGDNNPGPEPMHGATASDPLPAVDRLVVEWRISRADVPRWNGIVLAVQGDNRNWERTRDAVSVHVRGDAGGTRYHVELVTDPRPGSPPLISTPYSPPELADGFIVRLTVFEAGWELEVEGLGIPTEPLIGTGDWLGRSLSDFVSPDRHVAVWMQGDNADLVAREMSVDRIAAWRETCP